MKEDFASGKVQFVLKQEIKKVTTKAKKIERPELAITENESLWRAQKIFEFLCLVHPQNTGGGFKNPFELKFLLRGDGATTSLGGYTSLYGLDSEKELERFAQILEENLKFSVCSYYSLFTYNKDKEVKVPITDKNGRSTFEHKKLNKIVPNNAVETSVLPMDFDGISKEEYQDYRNYFKGLGINTLGVFTGYGYQMYILSDKPIKKKSVFEEFTLRLLKLGLPVDPSITDPSRVFRMPYTRNCKSYSVEFKYYSPYNPEGIETTVADWCVERYDYKEIFRILDKEIERLNPSEQEQTPQSDIVEEKSNQVSVVTKKPETSASEDNFKCGKLYEHLIFSEQPIHIQNILKGTRPGLRNACVLYLTPYLNRVLGLTQEQALETLQTFNSLCSPSIPDEKIKSDYYRISENYAQYKKGIYTPAMAEEFGQEELDTLIYADFDEIHFDNEVINQFDEIHHSAVPLYLAMKYLEVVTERNNFTKEEIAKAASVSDKTVQRYIGELTKRSIVVNVKGNPKQGIKKGYKINQYGAYINGFTKLSKLLVKDMIKELLPSEMALYIYFMFKAKSMDKVLVFTSQEEIALEFGLDQSNISRISDQLKEKGYIKKQTRMSNQNRKKSKYTLRNS